MNFEYQIFSVFSKDNIKQESIPVECVPLLPPTIHASPLDVRIKGVPEVNKFEQVSRDGHHMSLPWDYYGWGWVVLMFHVQWGGAREHVQ